MPMQTTAASGFHTQPHHQQILQQHAALAQQKHQIQSQQQQQLPNFMQGHYGYSDSTMSDATQQSETAFGNPAELVNMPQLKPLIRQAITSAIKELSGEYSLMILKQSFSRNNWSSYQFLYTRY
jgi:hypothetical protein